MTTRCINTERQVAPEEVDKDDGIGISTVGLWVELVSGYGHR